MVTKIMQNKQYLAVVCCLLDVLLVLCPMINRICANKKQLQQLVEATFQCFVKPTSCC